MIKTMERKITVDDILRKGPMTRSIQVSRPTVTFWTASAMPVHDRRCQQRPGQTTVLPPGMGHAFSTRPDLSSWPCIKRRDR